MKTAEQMEEVYKEALHQYKMQVDEILTQQSEMSFELQTYKLKVRASLQKDSLIFTALLDREKEIAIGLIFAKTGKKITDKMMNSLTRRQVSFSFQLRQCLLTIF